MTLQKKEERICAIIYSLLFAFNLLLFMLFVCAVV